MTTVQPVRWRVAPLTQLERFEETWRQLHACAWASPVLAWEFIAALVKGFARGDELLAVGTRHERPLAMGILQRSSRVGWSTFQPAQAPIGAWLHDPEADLEDLLRALLRALPVPALVLGITQQDPLRAPPPAAQGCLATLNYIETGSVLVNRSYDIYWNERERKLRYEVRRRLARLAEQGLQPVLEKITRPEAVAAQVEDFGALESAGWKAAGGTAVHAGNAQGAFYRDLLTRFCGAGRGRIYRYQAGERLLAMQLCIEQGGTLAFLKTTYDERLRACAPGVLMKAEIFRELFEDGGIARIEFYGSLKEWQLKWIDARRTQYHLNAYRSRLLRAAHAFAVRRRAGVAAD